MGECVTLRSVFIRCTLSCKIMESERRSMRLCGNVHRIVKCAAVCKENSLMIFLLCRVVGLDLSEKIIMCCVHVAWILRKVNAVDSSRQSMRSSERASATREIICNQCVLNGNWCFMRCVIITTFSAKIDLSAFAPFCCRSLPHKFAAVLVATTSPLGPGSL